MKKWKCEWCGFICKGDQPPENCGRCEAVRENFVEVPSYREMRKELHP